MSSNESEESEKILQRYLEQEKISVSQAHAIEWLARGTTQKKAAREADVSEVTVSRWMNDDVDFKKALLEYQWKIRGGTVQKAYSEAMSDSLEYLIEKAREEREEGRRTKHNKVLQKMLGIHGNFRETIEYLKDLLVIREEDEHKVLKAFRQVDVPASLVTSVMERLDRLSKKEQKQLEENVRQNGRSMKETLASTFDN